MRRTSCWLSFLAVLTLVALTERNGRAQKPLRWQFKSGEKLALLVKQKSTTQTSVNNRTLTMQTELEMDVAWSVDAVNDQQTAQMTQAFTRVAVKLQMPGVPDVITYDSAKTKSPSGVAKSFAARIRPLIGAKFHLSMTSRGEITEVRLSKEASKTLADVRDGSRLKSLFSKEKIADILRQSTMQLPATPLAAKAMWATTREQTSTLGKIRLTSDYVYQGSEQRGPASLERIDVSTKVALLPPDKPSLRQTKLKQHAQTGTIYFDNQAGRMVSSFTKQETVTERMYREQRLTTKDTSETRLTVKPSNAP